jgi:hypothetical protein
LDWWREPELLEVLRSNVPLRVMGERLGISISHAKRLRDRARLQHLPRFSSRSVPASLLADDGCAGSKSPEACRV